MTLIQLEGDVDRPVEEVWAVLQDEQRSAEWKTGCRAAELVEGERGRVGSRYRLEFTERGKAFTIEATVVASKENEEYTVVYDHETMSSRVRTLLRPEAGGTHVAVEMSVSGNTFAGKAMIAAGKGMMRRRMEDDLGRFKRLVESGA